MVRLFGPDELWPGGIWQSQSPPTKPESQQLQASSLGIWLGSFELHTPRKKVGRNKRRGWLIVISAKLFGNIWTSYVSKQDSSQAPLCSSITPDTHINTCNQRSLWANPLQYKGRCQPLRQTHTHTQGRTHTCTLESSGTCWVPFLLLSPPSQLKGKAGFYFPLLRTHSLSLWSALPSPSLPRSLVPSG